MVKVTKHGVILEATDKEFENQAVLNPTCIQEGNTVHMFYRAVKKGNFSSIGYCRLDGPLKIVERMDKPIIAPSESYEIHGTEDPRVVFFEGKYYLFYTAYDGKNALIAYATSKDLKRWTKQGVISPRISYDEAEDLFRQNRSKLKEKYFFFESYYKDISGKDVLLWEKDAFILPERVDGKIGLIHRILPDIQLIYFNDFKDLTDDYWKEYLKNLGDFVVLESEHDYESRNVGGGAALIETKQGWLMIYHSVQDRNKGKIYHASAALLDKKQPTKILGRLKIPLFSPFEKYELDGDVNNVVFPSGTAIFGDDLYIYYGAADKRIAAASVNLNSLINELLYKDHYSDRKQDIREAARAILKVIGEEKILIPELKLKLKNEKDINFSDNLILIAIGWLTKERKIIYCDSGKNMSIRKK
jgi:beta-1,2-mannobiose phosphorylase / 1,2-beta-oligomannan phosphorylase